MSNFSCINKKEQLFYNIAEQSAETYKGKIANLKIYIVFILYHGHEIAKTNLKYFIKEFIDTLLTYISVDALFAWKQLHNYVSSENLSQEAVDFGHEHETSVGLGVKLLVRPAVAGAQWEDN